MFSGTGHLHNNTIYPLLKKYVAAGWLTQRASPGERGQTRLLYELTPAGRATLVEKLADFSAPDAASDQAFRLRVGLFDCVAPADRERIVRLRDAYLSSRLDQIAVIAKSPALQGWGRYTVSFVIDQAELERRWLAELLNRISGGRA